MLNDVAGKPLYGWDSRDHRLRHTYDALRRPTEVFLQEGNAKEILVQRTVYGEGQGDALNHRGKVFQVFDGVGIVTSEAYDFKGNLLHSNRKLATDYKNTVNWTANVPLEPETYATGTAYRSEERRVGKECRL